MTARSLPGAIRIREVGPRDGLQAESPLPAAARAGLVDELAAAGLVEIEAVSFVSPKAVPAMAGAAEVMAAVTRVPGVLYAALVPNRRGAELALEAGVDALTVTVSASESYSQKNVHLSVDESVSGAAQIVGVVAGRMPVDVVVSCAFGSPYEGDLGADAIHALGLRLLAGGADALTFADTTGMATPRLVRELIDRTGPAVGLHLHETRGTGLVNAYAALEVGVTRFDTSVGGLGGSPFAVGSAGNLATEDLVHLCEDLGIKTGVQLDRLLEISARVAGLVGHPVPSRIAAAGPRWRLAAGEG
jgi:hydroxymethylglutaryl-CoA lyase